MHFPKSLVLFFLVASGYSLVAIPPAHAQFDGFSRPTFEEDVIGHHDRRAAMLLQQRFDVLDEVELLVGGRRPEVITLDDIPLLGDLALFAHDRCAALLPKRRIGHHDVEPIPRISGQGVGHDDGQVFVAPDPVEHQIHRAEPCCALDQLPSFERALLELSLFILGQGLSSRPFFRQQACALKFCYSCIP